MPVDDKPIPTQPPSRTDQLLQDKFIEDLIGQSGRMDDLARQLITLELAVAGLYAAALKLLAGAECAIDIGIWLYLAFGCWGIALALALSSLIPRRYEVDKNRLFGDRSEGAFSIQGYFRQSALHKRWLLLPSALLCFIGICAAVLTLF